MLGDGTATIASYLGWWADAGVVDACTDAPFDWLATEAKRAAVPAPAVLLAAPRHPASAHVAPPAPPATEHDDLAALDAWLAGSPDVPGRDWAHRLVLPEGPADAPLMLLADVPDIADVDGGRLFAGAQGKLLGAMLGSIGLSREACRIGSIAFTRPIAGKITPAAAPPLLALAQRHIALARPRALLLLGPQAAQLMTGEALTPEPRQRVLNQDGAKVATFAIHHPRLLLERPLLKRTAWEGLKLVREHVRK